MAPQTPLVAMLMMPLVVMATLHTQDVEYPEYPEYPEFPEFPDPEAVRGTAKVQSVTGVVGRPSDLPCELNPRTPGDRPKLILWYKRGLRSPVFSYDGRRGPEQDRIQEEGVALTVARGAVTLTLTHVAVRSAGVYECRVDFFKSPTHTTLFNLTVIEPPRRVEIEDSQRGPAEDGVVGPYKENQTVVLSCYSKHGTPLPNVTWFKGETLLDGEVEEAEGVVVRNSLTVDRITREWHNQSLTCAASNTRLTNPVVATIVVHMFLLPTSVIVGNPGAVREGHMALLTCEAMGSRPLADLTWTVRGFTRKPIKASHQQGLTSSSTLLLNVTREDDGSEVLCTATNPSQPERPLTNTTTLAVQYPPTVVAALGRSLSADHLHEGVDVYFTCSVVANPHATTITWYHEDQLQLQNVSAGVILSGESLVLQKVSRRRAGNYQCAATNAVATTTSPPVHLRIKYKPECQTTPTTYFIYDKPINVTCTISSYPAVRFVQWQWNNSNELIKGQSTSEGTDGGAIDAERVSSQLTVYPTEGREDRVLSCWAVNEMGMQEQPCAFAVKVAQTLLPVSSCRLANITVSSLSLSCQWPNVATAGLTLYHAEVYFDNMTLFANVTSRRPNFNVSRLDAGTSYQIKVYVTHGPVTSQPVVVSAYTSRTSRPSPGDPSLEEGGTSVGGTLGGLAVGVVVLVALVGVRKYDRRRQGKRKQEARTQSDDASNPDVVPNIEETYDLLAPGGSKSESASYEAMEVSINDDVPKVPMEIVRELPVCRS